jgi:16S rRNA (uracil1498-N3)-methyltransferase
MTAMASGAPRLYVAQELSNNAQVALNRAQSHYLVDVLRLKPGDPVRVFNGSQGEWLAHIVETKKTVTIRCERHIADVKPPPDIDYVFAPLKHLRLDYVVQKATELGVRRLRPVITRRTITTRFNLERMRANVIEAAEQCNLVYIPEVYEAQPLADVLSSWESGRSAIYCDEAAAIADPLKALESLKLPTAVIIGPEGGFTPEERQELHRLPFVTAISLGPRIMRADTAAIAAISLVQAALGDWRT